MLFATQRTHEKRFNEGAATGQRLRLSEYSPSETVFLDIPPDPRAEGWRVYGTELVWPTPGLDGTAPWHSVLLFQRACGGSWESRLHAVRIFSREAVGLRTMKFSIRPPKVLRDGMPREQGLSALRQGSEHPAVPFARAVEIKYGALLRAAGVDCDFHPRDRLSAPRPAMEKFQALAAWMARRGGVGADRARRALESAPPQTLALLTGLSQEVWRRFCYGFGANVVDVDLVQGVEQLFLEGRSDLKI